MTLPAPVGYLYWYTTSIVLATLTLLHAARRLYARYAPRERSPHDTTRPSSDSADSTPSLTSFTWSRRHEQLFVELPMPDRELSRATRIGWTLRAMWRKFFTLVAVPLSFDNVHIATLHLTEFVWATSYITGVIVLSLYGASWDSRVWSDQAAWVAVAQVPLIVALAGRNNLVSFLTGISYDRLDFLNRWSTRVCYAGIWIHVAGRLHLAADGHDLHLADDSTRWAIVGLVAMSLLVFVSLRPIRHVAYEFFVAAQTVLVAVSLVAWILHWRAIAIWLYPGIAIWALDKLCRVGRLVVANRLWRGRPKAHLSSLTPSTLLLSIPAPTQRWAAGQHFYLSMPCISRLPWESHPFTAATVPSAYDDGELKFIIRVRGGFTRRLRDRLDEVRKLRGLRALEACEIEVSATVEGAYGRASRLDAYDAVVLVAGGSGISYALAHALAIIDAAKAGRGATRAVRLVWMVRSAAHVAWIAPLLAPALLDLPPTLKISLHVHITSPPPSLGDAAALDLDAVYWRDHRPTRLYSAHASTAALSDVSSPPKPGIIQRMFGTVSWSSSRPTSDSSSAASENGSSVDSTLVGSPKSKRSKTSVDEKPTAHYLPTRIVGSQYAPPSPPATKLSTDHPFLSPMRAHSRRPSPPWTPSTVALSISSPVPVETAAPAPVVTLDSWAARHLPPSRARSASLDSSSSAASFYSTATHLTPVARPGAPRPAVPPVLAPHVVWHDGRADLDDALADTAAAMGRGCTLAVAASGPAGLLDSARQAARRAIRLGAALRGKLDVVFVDERFEW
ncbi:ferric-chelate reductase Frp1 [Cryptotrichosporon argae]